MGTYRVKPDGSGWVVSKNGRTVSNHRKKARAKMKAKQQSSGGDTLVIHGANGQIINRRQRR